MKPIFFLIPLLFTILNISSVDAQTLPEQAIKSTDKSDKKLKGDSSIINVEPLDTNVLEQLSDSTKDTLEEKKKAVSDTAIKSQEALLEKDATQNKVDNIEEQLEKNKQEIEDASKKKSKSEIKQLKKLSRQLEKKHNDLRNELKIKAEKVKKSFEQSKKQQGEISRLNEQLHQLDLEKNKRTSPREKALSMSFFILISIIIILIKDKLSNFIEKRLTLRSEKSSSSHSLRVLTFLRIINWSTSVLIVAVTIFLILELFGFDSTHTLAGAGMLGMAIGFGAQQFIKDIFSGLFLVFEGQYSVHDFITIDKHSGNVEDINLRFTKLRNYDGNVIYIPNGNIHSVINHGKVYANSVIKFYVDVDQDINQVFALIRSIVSELRKAPDLVEEILGDVELLGINAFTPTGVEVKFRIKTVPQSQWMVGREIRLALKNQFALEGIRLFQYQYENQLEK